MITQVIQAVLAADSTLTSILTGGIYRFEETGRNGIGRDSTPNAYSEDGFLLPSAVLHPRAILPWGGLQDSSDQSQSTRQMVEVYLYADGDTGYEALETARNRIYTLLHHTFLDGAGHLKKVEETEAMPDPVLNNASVWRLVFSVVFVERGQ